MIDIVERLYFDAFRCEVQFSKGVAQNIEEGAHEIARLRAALQNIAIGGIGDRYWTLVEVRAYAQDAYQQNATEK